jgi:hypothetical protein
MKAMATADHRRAALAAPLFVMRRKLLRALSCIVGNDLDERGMATARSHS